MSKIAKKEAKTLNPTWSLTVGNGGENHTGMEFLGNLRKKGQGWDLDRLLYAKGILEKVFGKTVELHNLNETCYLGDGFYDGAILSACFYGVSTVSSSPLAKASAN